MTDYNSKMNQRLETLDELHSRAERLLFEIQKLQEAWGLATAPNIAEVPVEQRVDIAQDVKQQLETVETTMNDTKDAYQNIDIDALIQSMDLNLEL